MKITARRRRTVVLLLATFGLVLAAAIYAQNADEPATKSPEERFVRILSRVTNAESDHSRQFYRAAFSMRISLDRSIIAAKVLGDALTTLSEEEKLQFHRLLERLVTHSHNRLLSKLVGRRLEVQGVESKEGAAIVKFAAFPKNPGDDTIEFAYRLHDAGGAWVLVDVVTEGVSLVSSYRSQFTKIFGQDGFHILMEKMKAKVKQSESEYGPEYAEYLELDRLE